MRATEHLVRGGLLIGVLLCLIGCGKKTTSNFGGTVDLQVFCTSLADHADEPFPQGITDLFTSIPVGDRDFYPAIQIQRVDLDPPAVLVPKLEESFSSDLEKTLGTWNRVKELRALHAQVRAQSIGELFSKEGERNVKLWEVALQNALSRTETENVFFLQADIGPTVTQYSFAGRSYAIFPDAKALQQELAKMLSQRSGDGAMPKFTVVFLKARDPDPNSEGPRYTPNPPVVPTPAATTSAVTLLRFSGSNTIGGKLLPALATAYLQREGCSNVHTVPGSKEDESLIQGTRGNETVQIDLHAHGSTTAFQDLKAGLCDIGMASRKIKPAERNELLPLLGDLDSNASEHVLALDGIAVIVHPANPVKALSVDQLAGLFSGQTTDWAQVGGRTGQPVIYARDNKSGTFDFFNDAVLKAHGKSLSPAAIRFEDSDKLSAAVSADQNGIGFIGLNYIGANKVVAISDQGVAARKPTLLTVKTLDYLLARQLYLYTAASPTNPNVSNFIEFALGDAAQPVIASTGLIDLRLNPITKPGEIDPSDPRNQSADWRRLTQGATEIPTRYRFRTGSSELDPKGNRDIGRIVGVLSQPQYQDKHVILIGFADSSGTPDANRELSRKRADIVKDELTPEGLDINDVVGLGAQAFVAPNDTVDGKEKNRRVEVWVK